MKRFIPLFLAFAVLSGCTSEKHETTFVPEPSPAPLPELFEEPAYQVPVEKVLYLDGVPEELFDSPAYREAFYLPSVISFNGEPLTRGDEVRSFVETVALGGSGELYYFSFSYLENWKEIYGEDADQEEAAPYRVYGTHFAVDDGKVTKRNLFNYNWEDELIWAEGPYSISKIELNKWGMLCIESESSSEPMGYPVISGYELYEDYVGMLDMEKYLDPIYYDGCKAFDIADGSIDHWLALADDIATYKQYNGFWADYPDGVIPRSYLIDFMVQWLDMTEEQLDRMILSNRFYDAVQDAIIYEGGRGGRGPLFRIREWNQDGDILSIIYDSCNNDTGEPYRTYRLTVRLLDDGSFRYRSLEDLGDVKK